MNNKIVLIYWFFFLEMDKSVDPKFLFFKQQNEINDKDFNDMKVDILGTIIDLDEWKKLDGVKTNVKLKDKLNDTWLLTGTIYAKDFERISKLPFVKSLKLGDKVYPL